MKSDTPHKVNSLSLEYVAGEMRLREESQDKLLQDLTSKATFLFTTGTAALGAGGAFMSLLLQDSSAEMKYTLPFATVVVVAFSWLSVSFFMGYRVVAIKRAPEPEELFEYVSKSAEVAKLDVTDARRHALGKNVETLEGKATWLQNQMISLVVLIFGLVGTVTVVAVS